jgi:hypothetical protein
MQLSRDSAAFLFLRFNQSATHRFERLLGQFLVGDIDRRTDESGK